MKRVVYPYILSIFLCFLFSNQSFSYYYKINHLSMSDGVFRDFREEILFHNTGLLTRSKPWRRNLIKHHLNRKNRFLKLKLAIYTVKQNDSLKNIAYRSYLDVDTIISINALASSYDIDVGKKIIIPNMKGSLHYIKEEIDLSILAAKYRIPPSILSSINNINRDVFYKGEKVFIPFRKLSREERMFFSNTVFLQPVSGRISSGFGLRQNPFKNKRTFHGGIDIVATKGTPVYSSQSGKVIFSGTAGGYGKLIVLSHKYGYKTFYGHLSKKLVSKGEWVEKGDILGRVGSTGLSTGPHLHFEIRRFNSKKNPLKLTSH